MIETTTASAERWEDVRTVFGVKGDPAGCFCQYFIDRQWNRGRDANRQALHEQLKDTCLPSGLLAYVDGAPAGWAQVLPGTRLPRFAPRGHQQESDIWVLSCFVVRPEFWRRGVSTALLRAAIDHARSHGAQLLRARPTDTTITAKNEAGLFTGVLSTFEREGFEIVNRNRSKTLVQLAL